MPDILKVWTCADEALARVELGDKMVLALIGKVGPGVELENHPTYSVAARLHQSAAALSPLGSRPYEGISYTMFA